MTYFLSYSTASDTQPPVRRHLRMKSPAVNTGARQAAEAGPAKNLTSFRQFFCIAGKIAYIASGKVIHDQLPPNSPRA